MNHQSRFFTLLGLVMLFTLGACQAPAAPSPTATPLPTATALPTNTLIPPTNTSAPTLTLILSTNTPTVDSCEPGQNVFRPVNVTDYHGEIDGAKLTSEVEKLLGSEVEVTGKVVEAQYLIIPGEVDSTIVLINLMGSDGKTYKVMIELPDKGLSVKQYLPDTDIHAVGVVLGELPAPSPDFFKLNPNDGGKQYPIILAELASGGCK